MNCFSH